ncbi:ATP-binding cassette domain-containing protein [Anaeromyxobacter oryzae]|uniref:ABC transporter domain-containing protein n=1 Tax=Anaeromyxobacter oryzae TaxID=2918170 RepID=A0ABN6MX84_9BACT|nr:ATP-binding cassette domain-containing protein [Anaeromyxobacter oryzae]BDG04870.1 hypothetical protein AMOR_38660 [Anaeromyxobacter oryzae]
MEQPIVTLDRLDVSLGGARVLSGVSLTLSRGQGLAVLGPNGSGKSTLLRLLRGDVWPDPASAGRRLFHADDGASASPIGVRERLARVAPETQDAYVRNDWNLPVEAVIRSGFFDQLWPSEAATSAQAARVRAAAEALGVTHLLRRSFLELSRGEGRRVLLARALAPGPDALLLDEACDGLDAEARADLLGRVAAILRGGTAVVMATHRADEIVEEIPTVAWMEGGQIVRLGTREEAIGEARERDDERDPSSVNVPVTVPDPEAEREPAGRARDPRPVARGPWSVPGHPDRDRERPPSPRPSPPAERGERGSSPGDRERDSAHPLGHGERGSPPGDRERDSGRPLGHGMRGSSPGDRERDSDRPLEHRVRGSSPGDRERDSDRPLEHRVRGSSPGDRERDSGRPRGSPPGDRERDSAHPLGHGVRAGAPPILFTLRSVTVLVEGRPVLDEVDWTVRRGERWCVLGPNGAGKSTLLRLLAGTEQPARGEIDRLGLGPRAGADDLAGRVGLVSPELQARHRLDAPALDVVASGFAGSIGLAEPATARQLDGARRAAARLGISELLARRILSLSYGELRKVLLARALAPGPDVLLLDEPLAGLDPGARAHVLAVLDHLRAEGVAVVAVSHHADELPRAADGVLRIARGRVLPPRP